MSGEGVDLCLGPPSGAPLPRESLSESLRVLDHVSMGWNMTIFGNGASLVSFGRGPQSRSTGASLSESQGESILFFGNTSFRLMTQYRPFKVLIDLGRGGKRMSTKVTASLVRIEARLPGPCAHMFVRPRRPNRLRLGAYVRAPPSTLANWLSTNPRGASFVPDRPSVARSSHALSLTSMIYVRNACRFDLSAQGSRRTIDVTAHQGRDLGPKIDV